MSGPASAETHGIVEMYFDYSSPWAYLGTTQIERVAREGGARVRWRPFLLGGLFKEIGTPLVPIATMPEVKRRYIMKDLDRWAAHWGVPFRFTSRFPIRTVAPLRLTLLAPEPSRAALVHALMRASWVEDANLEDEATLRACARAAGLDAALAESLVGETGSRAAKDALRDATDEAVARGVPGAPTFFVGEEMFWGQDRLDFVLRSLQEGS